MGANSNIIKVETIAMLSQEARELLIKTQETIHNATATAKIFGVNKSTAYAIIRDYKARGTTNLCTNLHGRKSKLTSEDEEHIKELIEKNVSASQPQPHKKDFVGML